jgi:acetyl-CoA synthetase
MPASALESLRTARDLLLTLRSDHEKAAAEFVWPDVGERFNWAVDWFDAIARSNERPALVLVEEDGSRASFTFDEMARRSDQVAGWLGALGVGRGDSVLAMLGNQVELWDAMLALMKLGAVIVPTASAIQPSDLVDRVERAAARFVICNPADTAKFEHVPGDYGRICAGSGPLGWRDLRDAYGVTAAPCVHPGTSPQDRLLLYFTSGTTNRPKLVEHTQVSYPVGHLSTMYWIGIQPGDVHLNISSPGWAKHAWSCFFAPWLAEATVFVYNYGRFDAKALLDRIRSENVTSFCAPPTVWRMLINADLAGGPGKLRELVAAGEPLNPEVIAQVQRHWGLVIRDGFGQTETTAAIGNTPGAKVKPGSMGTPLPGVPVTLVDPITEQRADAEGEICFDLSRRAVNLMKGYLVDDGLERVAMADGLYHTGDIASVDEDGYITFIGRTDDVFKSSDYKISPFELESVLIEHPAVAEAAVVPAPDPVRLAVPKAYVALAPGYEPTRETALAILRYARDRLAPYQRVHRLEFFELPKTISGKIRRVELRLREQAAGSPPGDEWRDDQFSELKSL